jgi:hypothetical protein
MSSNPRNKKDLEDVLNFAEQELVSEATLNPTQPFLGVSNYVELADLLEVKKEELIKAAILPHTRYHYPVFKYNKFKIQKSNGGNRIIHRPGPKLKAIQRTLLDKVFIPENGFVTHPTSVGFQKDQDIIEIAKEFQGYKTIIALDIHDFFPTINVGKLKYYLKEHDVPEWAAWLLTKITTIEGSLPQGAPTSPMLSNLVFYNEDVAIEKLAEQFEFKYKRYADDIILGGSLTDPGQLLEALIKPIAKIVRQAGFKLNKKKTKIMTKPDPQWVLGIRVDTETLTYPMKDYRRTRAAVNNFVRHGALPFKDNASDVVYEGISEIQYKSSIIDKRRDLWKKQHPWLAKFASDNTSYMKHNEIFNIWIPYTMYVPNTVADILLMNYDTDIAQQVYNKLKKQGINPEYDVGMIYRAYGIIMLWARMVTIYKHVWDTDFPQRQHNITDLVSIKLYRNYANLLFTIYRNRFLEQDMKFLEENMEELSIHPTYLSEVDKIIATLRAGFDTMSEQLKKVQKEIVLFPKELGTSLKSTYPTKYNEETITAGFSHYSICKDNISHMEEVISSFFERLEKHQKIINNVKHLWKPMYPFHPILTDKYFVLRGWWYWPIQHLHDPFIYPVIVHAYYRAYRSLVGKSTWIYRISHNQGDHLMELLYQVKQKDFTGLPKDQQQTETSKQELTNQSENLKEE